MQRLFSRTVWGRPPVTALIAAEKGGSAVLVGAGAGVAFFVHDRVVDNPLWLIVHGDLSRGPWRVFLRLVASHVHALGPRMVLFIAIFLVFWGILLALEAIGVWWDYAWGEMLILVETVSFMPLELYDIARHPSLAGFGSLAFNLLILWYVGRLYQRRMARRHALRLAAADGAGSTGPRPGSGPREDADGPLRPGRGLRPAVPLQQRWLSEQPPGEP